MDALKLQAYLDGELSASEAQEVAAWVARDAEAAALLGELKMAKTAMASNELDVKVPETREFYWSKISREIERLESAEEKVVVTLPWWRKLAVPLGIAAVLMVVAMSAVVRNGKSTAASTANSSDTSTFTLYNEEGNNVTVVWVNSGETANGN